MSEERKELAKQWIDSLGNGTGGLFNHWRLSLISKRQAKDGTERPVRIRRFVEGCPPSYLKEAIDYLVSQAPYSDVIYNGQQLEGKYRPTLTYWRRDSQEMVNGVSRSDATYTIIQDLIEDDLVDSETALTQKSCSLEETTEWHWEEASVGEIPATGSIQGITYAIGNVRRSDDGTFDWQLVTRKALTQHTPETRVVCNSLGASITTELWDNVYGTVDAPTDHDGVPLEGLPLSCDKDQGVMSRMTVSENPDCTFKIAIERTTSAYDGFTWSDGSACKSRTNFVYDNVRTERPETLIPDPLPGQSITSSVKRNADMSWNVEFSIVETPANQYETWTQGSKCRPVEIRQHHGVKTLTEVQALIGNLYDLPDGVSRTARVNRNDDCSYDVSIEEVQPFAGAEETWEQGALHRKQIVYLYNNVSVKPPIPKVDVGVTVDANLRKNDDCTWSGSITVTYAVDGQLPKYTTRATIFETVDEEHHFGVAEGKQSTVGPVAKAGNGTLVERKEDRNPDGTIDITVRTTTELPDPGAHVSRRKTIRGTITTTTERNGKNSSTTVSKVGDEVQVEHTSGGRYNRTVTSASAESTETIGIGCTTQTHAHKDSTTVNQKNPPTISHTSAQNKETIVTGRMTELGTWDVETQTTTFNPVTATASHEWATEHATTTVERHSTNLNLDGGKFSETSITPDDHGAANTTKTVYTPIEVDSGWITWDSKKKDARGTFFYHNGIRVFKNLIKVPTSSSLHNVHYSISINRYGRYDGQIEYSDLYDWNLFVDEPGTSYETFDMPFYVQQGSGVIAEAAVLHGKSFLLSTENARHSFRHAVVESLRIGDGLGIPGPRVIGSVGIVFSSITWNPGFGPGK